MSDTIAATMPISLAAERVGLSVETLRYYERAGLIESVSRAAGGQRQYAEADIAWLEFLIRLRAIGMPIAQIREYARLRALGVVTTGPRLAMLRAHRARLAETIAELQRSAKALDDKIAQYEADLSAQGGHDHD